MQDAEERSLAALQDKAGNKRLAELRKALLSKEHKMRALREALVKLKQVRHWCVLELIRFVRRIVVVASRRRGEGRADFGGRSLERFSIRA